MKKLKVMTIVGTRPEIIRLSCVIQKLDEHTEHVFVHTGQNYDYELNEIFFDDMSLRKPDHFLNAAGGSAIETIANVLVATEKLLIEETPDAVLVLGDTNSCMALLAAKRRKIPTFHMEAGNRCFDQRVPEEINRKVVDHVADINLTYSDISRDYLLSEGLPSDLVIKTGSPLGEVLFEYSKEIQGSNVLDTLKLEAQKYFVLSVHREENVDSPRLFSTLLELIDRLDTEYQIPIVFSLHPRTRKAIEDSGEELPGRVLLMKPLGFSDYVHLQSKALAVLSDSGSISEESSILNFPALNLREAHERPEAIEEGAVMMTGMEPERVIQALSVLSKQERNESRTVNLVSDYSSINVSEKVVRIIHSYTDYVNRKIWKK